MTVSFDDISVELDDEVMKSVESYRLVNCQIDGTPSYESFTAWAWKLIEQQIIGPALAQFPTEAIANAKSVVDTEYAKAVPQMAVAMSAVSSMKKVGV